MRKKSIISDLLKESAVFKMRDTFEKAIAAYANENLSENEIMKISAAFKTAWKRYKKEEEK